MSRFSISLPIPYPITLMFEKLIRKIPLTRRSPNCLALRLSVMRDIANFNNILRAACHRFPFAPKNTNTNLKHIKASQNNFEQKKLFIKYWLNCHHPWSISPTFYEQLFWEFSFAKKITKPNCSTSRKATKNTFFTRKLLVKCW